MSIMQQWQQIDCMFFLLCVCCYTARECALIYFAIDDWNKHLVRVYGIHGNPYIFQFIVDLQDRRNEYI